MPRRNLAAYFSETNVRVPSEGITEKSKTPIFQLVVVTLTPVLEAGTPVLAEVQQV